MLVRTGRGCSPGDTGAGPPLPASLVCSGQEVAESLGQPYALTNRHELYQALGWLCTPTDITSPQHHLLPHLMVIATPVIRTALGKEDITSSVHSMLPCGH